MAKYVGELEEMYSALWRKCVRRFGENVFGDFLAIMRRRFGEIVRRFWRKRSAITLEIWRKVFSDLEKCVR